MARFNREDPRTVLPQLEKEVDEIQSSLSTVTHGQISIRYKDVDVTVAANSYTTQMVVSNCPSVAKHTARCVVGFNVFNQENNGANASLVFPYKMYINQTDQTINLALRNTASSAAVVTVRVLILYTRNS